MYVDQKKGFPMNLMLIYFKQIAGLLVDKVAKFSSGCQEVLMKASLRGEDMNKRHAEGWASLVTETKDKISAETAYMLADIKRIAEVFSRRSRHPPKSNHGGKGILGLHISDDTKYKKDTQKRIMRLFCFGDVIHFLLLQKTTSARQAMT
jgi:hypothetical protein